MTQPAADDTLAIEIPRLHVAGSPLPMPNPWDAGSARILTGPGYRSLATTSSGYWTTLGRPDGTG